MELISLVYLHQASAAQVMAHHAVACHAIVVAKPGAICKTTSGKVQRQACRAAFLAGEYTVVRSRVLLDTLCRV